MNQAVPANEYCGDFIPEESLNIGLGNKVDNGIDPDHEADRQKVEQTLLTNTEIFEAYFAMYI
jgi:hypothetical protein